MALFNVPRGIIPACDTADADDLSRLIKSTSKLPFIAGYKIGMIPALSLGLERAVRIARRQSDQPLIYDHQKFGTDVPELCSGTVISMLRHARIDSVIIFPLAGLRTLEDRVRALTGAGIVPMVGGEMTQPGYLQSEGGYMADESPAKMYQDAAALGVDYFIIPGTRAESMARYKEQLSRTIAQPTFLFPGIGRGQGGDIVQAFRQVAPFSSYAIVGRGIHAEPDRTAAALRLWQAIEEAGLEDL